MSLKIESLCSLSKCLFFYSLSLADLLSNLSLSLFSIFYSKTKNNHPYSSIHKFRIIASGFSFRFWPEIEYFVQKILSEGEFFWSKDRKMFNQRRFVLKRITILNHWWKNQLLHVSFINQMEKHHWVKCTENTSIHRPQLASDCDPDILSLKGF